MLHLTKPGSDSIAHSNAAVAPRSSNARGHTVLYVAVLQERFDVVKMLIESGANVALDTVRDRYLESLHGLLVFFLVTRFGEGSRHSNFKPQVRIHVNATI